MNKVYLVQVEDRETRRYLGVFHFSSMSEFDAFQKDPNMSYIVLGESGCHEDWADEVNDHGPIWVGMV